MDGKQQPVGNFRIEPPGIFLGRGCNPKLGKVKKRIQPEDIIINIGKTSEAPKPPRGHKWGGVVNDRCAVWLASWFLLNIACPQSIGRCCHPPRITVPSKMKPIKKKNIFL